ncbi:hypothetical protein C8F04DRAFT_1401496 [Mycena alexandri]|uniref:Uncharacterized protein n=1 Tax=Mycena alexandri TaxID=1745969 RepID=A0AAD6SBC8_9AGAR|nr:hypothetical protein C8F04DRAFT_1401496 [Mycena alexandri]
MSRPDELARALLSTRLSQCTVLRGLGADELVHAAADAALDKTLRGRATRCDGSGMWTSEETTHIAIRVPCVRAQPPDGHHFVNALEALRSRAGEYGLVVRRLHQLGANTTFGFFGSAWVFGSGGFAMTTSLPIVRVREDVLRGLFDSAYALAVRRAPLTGGCADPTFTPSPSSAYGWRALDVLSGEVNHSPQSMCRSSSSPPSHLRLNHVCHRVEELRWWSPPPSLLSACARRSEPSAQFRHPKFNNCLIFLARARALLHLHLHRVRSTRLSAIPLRLASDVRSVARCGGGLRCLCTERLDVVSVSACVLDSRGIALVDPFPVSIAPSVLNALDTTYRDALASAPSSDGDDGEGVGVSLRRKWTTTRGAQSGGHGAGTRQYEYKRAQAQLPLSQVSQQCASSPATAPSHSQIAPQRLIWTAPTPVASCPRPAVGQYLRICARVAPIHTFTAVLFPSLIVPLLPATRRRIFQVHPLAYFHFHFLALPTPLGIAIGSAHAPGSRTPPVLSGGTSKWGYLRAIVLLQPNHLHRFQRLEIVSSCATTSATCAGDARSRSRTAGHGAAAQLSYARLLGVF